MAAAETVFPAQPASVGAARRWLAEVLESWDLYGVDYDISVVLSELVTNAVLHAGTSISVRVKYEGGTVRLEVEDSSPVLPVTRHRSPRATTGRGLVLVSALASHWGWEPKGQGKVVWAEFDGVDALERSGELSELRSTRTPVRQAARGRSGGTSDRDGDRSSTTDGPRRMRGAARAASTPWGGRVA